MKYHFLGDMECPSWLLEEICSNFSSLTVLKFRELCDRASHLMIDGHDKPILASTSEGINVMNQHENLLLIGNWLLLKPAGYQCSSEDLEKEVVQLGMPPEHGKQLKKTYEMYKDQLQQKVLNLVHREPHATILSATPTSFTMQTGTEITNVSMSVQMMNQFRNDIENSLVKFRDLADTLSTD